MTTDESDVSSEYSTSSSFHHRLQQEAVHKLSSQAVDHPRGAAGGSSAGGSSPRSKLSAAAAAGSVVIRGRTGSSSAAAAAAARRQLQPTQAVEGASQAIALTDYSSSPTSVNAPPDQDAASRLGELASCH